MWSQLNRESILKKIIIASNFDGDYDPFAVKNARLFLTSPDDQKEPDLKSLWAEETENIQAMDQLCSICQSENIAYTQDLYFCTEEIKDIDQAAPLKLPDFIPSIISDGKIAIAHTSRQRGFRYAKGKLRLCSRCLESHQSRQMGTLKIELKEYYEHPMYEYYQVLGFNRIKETVT
jgi:hypothetical protein